MSCKLRLWIVQEQNLFFAVSVTSQNAFKFKFIFILHQHWLAYCNNYNSN